MCDNAYLSTVALKLYGDYLNEPKPTLCTTKLNNYLENRSVLSPFHLQEYEAFCSTPEYDFFRKAQEDKARKPNPYEKYSPEEPNWDDISDWDAPPPLQQHYSRG